MKQISVLDTSICSSNLGDQIIMDSVNKILEPLFADALFIRMPTHDVIFRTSYGLIKRSAFTLVGGTNLLSSNMNSYNQWKVGLWDSLFIRDIILMGVGWWQYQKSANLYTKILYQRILSKDYLHSVRDGYTEKQLRAVGFENVINTACPTMWMLNEEHCQQIPQNKAESVLVTFTEYNQKKEYDRKLIDLLLTKYENVYFWTQQPKDYPHMQALGGESVIYLSPSLNALDTLLQKKDVDYIGTRLHAGIRALQHQRRTLILAVDNRALEIANDTNLPVIRREDLEAIASWITTPSETHITLPQENIKTWTQQFVS
ncbi:polysaccharide pyruvyl transferase family protein [Spirulina sp. CS-785/01]|uniref:polysaccharide pyruvyl transferase family protein n=1 Tax=Spirulina sp. CS-785/01 TaxID=3021716 RepID=UPI00232DD0B4|nr:polysaccharide pyruvyl transferase family protein [Spirulina sp. CS-785/01]MDB9315910.1 polysaccharide pyruvyl transferase family protein [Spirulina sp. CS-785/01]